MSFRSLPLLSRSSQWSIRLLLAVALFGCAVVFAAPTRPYGRGLKLGFYDLYGGKAWVQWEAFMEDPSKGEAGALCISKDHCLTVDFRSGIPEVIQIEAPTIPKGDTGFEINGTYFKDMGISAPLMIKASRQQFFEDVLNLAKLEGGNHTIKVDLDFLTLARNHTLLEDKDNYENIWSKFRTEIAEARKNHSSLVKFDALCQKESRNYRVGVYNLKEKYWRSWPGSGASYDVEPAAFCTGLRCLTVDSRTEPPKIIELPLPPETFEHDEHWDIKDKYLKLVGATLLDRHPRMTFLQQLRKINLRVLVNNLITKDFAYINAALAMDSTHTIAGNWQLAIENKRGGRRAA